VKPRGFGTSSSKDPWFSQCRVLSGDWKAVLHNYGAGGGNRTLMRLGLLESRKVGNGSVSLDAVLYDRIRAE